MSAAELQTLASQVHLCPLATPGKQWFSITDPTRGQALPIAGVSGLTIYAHGSCTVRTGAGIHFSVNVGGQGLQGKSIYICGITPATPPQNVRAALVRGLLNLATTPQMYMWTEAV